MQNYEIAERYLIGDALQCPNNQKTNDDCDCILHTSCRLLPAEDIISQPFQVTLAQAYSIMQRLQGVGIAANQIGIPYQFFIMERDPLNSRYQDNTYIPTPKTICINPIIEKVSAEKVCLYHACLSCLAHHRGLVATYETIEVSYMNERAEQINQTLTAWDAIIFQHEFNHLLGRTYLDAAIELIAVEVLREANQGKVPAPRLMAAKENIPVMIPKNYLAKAIC